MKFSNTKFAIQKTFHVIFTPDEKDQFLDAFPDATIVNIIPRTDLKPWGTREAVLCQIKEFSVKNFPPDFFQDPSSFIIKAAPEKSKNKLRKNHN